ncbi:MAG: nucleotide sugar dehydrogenase [Sorangiineae bacterium]|nr:nucleotide sugar dehydrogenase [Polyangiaceae bacterium]MEB2321170.1 nucleotide sugar dehydrogenase [Sorangiineae bacterium]
MSHKETLLDKLARHDATVGVIGLGYIGLPLWLAFAESGFVALGFDVDPRKVAALDDGRSYIGHIPSARVCAAVEKMSARATTEFSRLGECDAIMICVPTPLTEAREPDLSYVTETTRAIARTLRPGQLVVLESTTYPGTTDTMVRQLLEESGLTSGRDFFLAYSPEREDPGNPRFHTSNIPKVVGGVDTDAAELAERLYSQVISAVVRVSNAATAEATKLTENVFRAVNIALMNELKVVFEPMGIDIWEVLDAASTKPFGFMRFDPGPGWGGHCIPLDPFYLSWKARENGLETRFIELAGEINRDMPSRVVKKVESALDARGTLVRGARILILGVAYKRDVGDTRESPAFPIARALVALGAELSYHDPHVAELPETRSWPAHPKMSSVALTPELLASRDAVIIVTDHASIDFRAVKEHAPLVIDCRGVYRGEQRNVIKA